MLDHQTASGTPVGHASKAARAGLGPGTAPQVLSALPAVVQQVCNRPWAAEPCQGQCNLECSLSGIYNLSYIFLTVLQESALKVLSTSDPARLPLFSAPATSKTEDVPCSATTEAPATAPNAGSATKSPQEPQLPPPLLDTLQVCSLACCCCLAVSVVTPLPS